MVPQKIVFNEVEYESVEQMPADIRRQYEAMLALLPDKNHNGIPDVFEQAGTAEPPRMTVTTRTRISINGQTYESLEELPPELREKYENLLAHNGVLTAGKPAKQISVKISTGKATASLSGRPGLMAILWLLVVILLLVLLIYLIQTTARSG
jgi:hypothetical protein